MKLINYPQYNLDYERVFGCVIGGRIVMTGSEWPDAIRYLRSSKVKKQFLPSYPWTNTMLLEDIYRKVSIKNGYAINIRVPMTRELADKFGLKNYKKRNYVIEVIN